MSRTYSRAAWRAVILVIVVILGHTCVFAQARSAVTRERVAEWLRYQEGQVHSARFVFEVTHSVTPPGSVSLIREACRNRGQENDYVHYLVTDEFVARNNGVVQWWRKGVAERSDRYPYSDAKSAFDANAPVLTTAFDGQVVRALGKTGTGLAGSINTVDGADWNRDNRVGPYSLIYEWYGTPYSKVVADAADFKMSPVVRDGKSYTEVTLLANKTDWLTAVLLLDENRRIVERQVYGKLDKEPAARLWEKVIISDYQSIKDAGGETIWFPRQAVYHRFCGALANGTPVEYSAETLRIREIALNIDIPDSKFVLTFPPGTRIYDGMTGLGFLDRAEELNALLDESVDKLPAAAPAKVPVAVTSEDEHITPASAVPKPRPAVAVASVSHYLCWVILAVVVVVLAITALVVHHRRTLRARQRPTSQTP